MEEKNVINLKSAKPEGNPSGTTAPMKLSYEELNQACGELSQQNQQMTAYIKKLHQQLQEMDIALQTRRLGYLFKVVELAMNEKALYQFHSGFVEACMAEIEESLTIPETDDTGDAQENQKEE